MDTQAHACTHLTGPASSRCAWSRCRSDSTRWSCSSICCTSCCPRRTMRSSWSMRPCCCAACSRMACSGWQQHGQHSGWVGWYTNHAGLMVGQASKLFSPAALTAMEAYQQPVPDVGVARLLHKVQHHRRQALHGMGTHDPSLAGGPSVWPGNAACCAVLPIRIWEKCRFRL